MGAAADDDDVVAVVGSRQALLAFDAKDVLHPCQPFPGVDDDLGEVVELLAEPERERVAVARDDGLDVRDRGRGQRVEVEVK